MKTKIILALPLFLVGCGTLITYPQYEDTMRYDFKETLVDGINEDSDLAVCFRMSPKQVAEEIHDYVLECVRDERSKREYELNFTRIRTYAQADGACARKAFVIKYADTIDLNSVPKKYMDRCMEYKTYYSE